MSPDAKHRISPFFRLMTTACLIAFALPGAFGQQTSRPEVRRSDLHKIPRTSKEKAALHHFGREINSPFIEYTPFITPDEKILYFQSDRKGGVGEVGDNDLWFSVNTNPAGQTPHFQYTVNMGRPINTGIFEGLPTLRLRTDGSYEMYFTSLNSRQQGHSPHIRKGPRQTNIYYSQEILSGANDPKTHKPFRKWTKPRPIIEINSDFHDRMPSISPDGRYLYFSSNRPGGFGRDDLWVSEYDFHHRRWRKPRNLGATLNTTSNEISPSIHADGITLYFSSDKTGGMGGFDIYVTQKDVSHTTFKPPHNLGTPYNSSKDDEYPTVPRDGNSMYFASNREGGFGSFDIYRANVPEFAKPEVVITLSGYVHDAVTMKGIEANIRVQGTVADVKSLRSKEVRNYATSKPAGHYSIDLLNKRIYLLTVSSPGYVTREITLDLRNMHRTQRINKQIALQRALAIPPSITLSTRFKNRQGEILKPNVTYTLTPKIKAHRILTSIGHDYRVKIALRGDTIQRLREHLSRRQYTLYANLSGYAPKTTTWRLDEIIKVDSRIVNQEYRTPDVILEASTKKQKDPKKEITEKKKEDEKKEKDKDEILVSTILYAKNHFRLTRAQKKALVDVYQRYKTAPKRTVIRLGGHADSDGGYKFNLTLSKRRAMWAKAYLQKLGVPKKLIEPNWYSYTRPKQKGKSEKAKAQNRRVEIRFVQEKATQ